MTYRSELFALVVLTSLLISPALGLELSHQVQSGVSELQLEAKGMRRNLAARTAARKPKLPGKSGTEAQLSLNADDETTLHIHSPHDVHRFAVHERRKRSIEEDETVSSDGYTMGDDNDEKLTRSIEEEQGSEGYAVENSEDQELIDQPSAWPKFGIVGERQAALYYSSFLVFTVFLYRNSANSRGANNLPKSGRY